MVISFRYIPGSYQAQPKKVVLVGEMAMGEILIHVAAESTRQE